MIAGARAVEDNRPQECPIMPVENTTDAAEAEVRRRLRERAEEIFADLEEAHYSALPGNHSPADAILLAHLMTTTDGYNYVKVTMDWQKRPTAGWGTTLVYLAQLEDRLLVRFALECRHDGHARQLAIIIDDDRPGERVPQKMEFERKLSSLGFRVLQFTELEILSDPQACRERVEHVLSGMSDDVLVDAGIIQPPHPRPE
jgi:hypothetical protein